VCTQAKHDSNTANWAALELRSDRCQKILSFAMFNDVSNLSILCGDAVEIMSHWFPRSSASQIFINHPQPPEHIDRGKADNSQNEGKHLLTAEFFKLLHHSLLPRGTITIVTDNQSYARLLLRIISENMSAFFVSGDAEDSVSLRVDCTMVGSHVSQEEADKDSVSVSVSAAGPARSKAANRNRFVLYRGDPDESVGHAVLSSSYFDRMWDKGEHSRRFVLYLVAV
jgi:tRNA G46 methylase TrmB